MRPSISVIIPTFNRRKLLIETLESVLNQTVKATEIIVVDDHSTDGTTEFVKQNYRDKVIVITNDGTGPGAARNAGMAIATGDFIKFFDSDDVMTNNTLEIQSRALLESMRGFVHGPYFFCTAEDEKWHATDGIILNFYAQKNNIPLWHHMMIDGLFIPIPGMLFRRDLLEKVGRWREDVTAYEDWDYLFRLSMLEPHPIHRNECAFIYRLHGKQTTELNFTDAQRDHDKFIVLTDLLETKILTDSRFSYREKIFFNNKFYQMSRDNVINFKKKKADFIQNRFFQFLVWQTLRIRLKLGRIRTSTSWQPCHGPLKSDQVIDRYLSFLS